MAQINLRLPKTVVKHFKEEAKHSGFPSLQKFFLAVFLDGYHLRQKRRIEDMVLGVKKNELSPRQCDEAMARWRKWVDAQLLEGLNSGEPIRVTKRFWIELKAGLKNRKATATNPHHS